MVRKGRRGKLTPEIKEFIDSQMKAEAGLNYLRLIKLMGRRFGVQVSKATISKRAKALNLKIRRGRKRIAPVGKKPAHSVFLDCAGAFFLKGAELETGLLKAINQLFAAGTESSQARKTLKLAQQINALLLYAPVFGLKTTQDIVAYQRRGLLYLTEQKTIPTQEEISQYLKYLASQKLLLPIIKEVTRTCTEAMFVRIDFSGQTFYLDAQGRTVWPNAKVPRYFSTTINKVTSYIKNIFESPVPQRPLILQTASGYTFLPSEMFSLLRCFEGVRIQPISQIVAMGKSGQTLASWYDLKPSGKCYFIFPLTPWQYARLQGTQIIRGFHQYHIGPAREIMTIADAQIRLLNPQRNENIRLRAALVRRKQERIALVTNISRREERYIRRIAEAYFTRWPDTKIKTYYDLMEEAHQEMLGHTQSQTALLPLTLGIREGQNPENVFRLFLRQLHRIALRRFFPSENEPEPFTAMCEKFYRQNGYLKIKQDFWEIILQPFPQKNLQEIAQLACHKFNQSGLEFPAPKRLRIYLQSKK